MLGPTSGRLLQFWRRLSNLDRAALALAAVYAIVLLARVIGMAVPGAGLIQFLFILAVAATSVFHLISWIRGRLLWSLRNRLVVAYLFIAVVPVLLLAVIGGLSLNFIYQQLGAYILHKDLQSRIEKLQATADAVMVSFASPQGAVAPGAPPRADSMPEVANLLSLARVALPGINIDTQLGQQVLKILDDRRRGRFSGMVQSKDQVWLVAVVSRRIAGQVQMASLSVPLTSELLDSLASELGPVRFSITRPRRNSDPPELAGLPFVRLKQVRTTGRSLAPAVNWFDFSVEGTTEFETILLSEEQSTPARCTLFGFVTSRASLLNRSLFSLQGVVGNFLVQLLFAVAIVFLVIEVFALVTGINLTRTITRAVDDLSRATQLVQAGDFSHRVRVQSRDQLGALGDSFNTMTSSISGLIEEQRQRQRLENELSIAREVQAQLFPQKLPAVPGTELAALCRAARMVSGDYYDFVQLGPTLLGMVIADISGKGISAALLMASLQAALRSQLLLDIVIATHTSELVSRLNRHLFLNTSDDRYATLFYAVYDSHSRMLYYTNAGHLPPLLVAGDQVRKLEEGGLVVGLFDDCVYEQGCVRVEPGSLLVAYSDGMTEPENVYGEQFGSRRLAAEVVRHRHNAPPRLAELLISASEEWGQSPEQADDMTVIVARLG